MSQSESQEEQFNQALGFAGLGVLGLMTSLSLVGLITRIWLTWRLAKGARPNQRRLSVSTASSSGGFESLSPPPAPSQPPGPPAALLCSDLYSCPTTPHSPASTVSYYLDQRSVWKILNTTFSFYISVQLYQFIF